MHKDSMIELFNNMGIKFRVLNCIQNGLIYRTFIILNKRLDYRRDRSGISYYYYCFIFDKKGNFEEQGLFDE